ncbi:MAG: hypothetical protein AMJ69_06960 [Gammaproteobacteria bacterium SG8_47]|nr:MAG: hypothetical protein AMJ69_06960 [Gammaproteobacteria bacterium SG8_47]
MDWPNDTDGEVLRRLEAEGVDLAAVQEVTFDVDFDGGPPDHEAVLMLRKRFKTIEVLGPFDDGSGCVVVTIHSTLTYAFVTETQREITALMQSYGGHCESWGVWHS